MSGGLAGRSGVPGARRVLAALALAAAALLACGNARAQAYAFEVPTALLDAHVERDGTLTLDYVFTFRNEDGAHAIDAVDVGLPTPEWDVGRARAWIDGEPVDRVVRSTYVDDAVAAELGARAIPAGGTGEVRVLVEGVGGLLFTDTSNPGWVSLRLTPTWFDAGAVRGSTRVRVVLHLPPGVPAGVLKWHREPWIGQVEVEASAAREAHAAVVFEREYRLTGAWPGGGVGVSFPATSAGGQPLVAGVRRVTAMDLLRAWVSRPDVRGPATVSFLVAYAVGFFWATRRTGCALWGMTSAALLVACAVSPFVPWIGWPLLVLAVVLVARARRRKRRRYVPAVASVEGGGIKRGLTAPEAACLLEAPPQKLLLLVLYGLSKKGLATLSEKDGGRGLLARAAEGLGRDAALDVRLAADRGTVLHPYESAFLARLATPEPVDVATLDWAPALEGLARHAAQRLKGYDLDETRGYYQAIVARAWKEAETAGTVELKQDVVDRTFDWLVLDRDAFGRMGRWERSGWRYASPWWPHASGARGPVGTAGGVAGGARMPSPPSLPGKPSASDVAGSFAGRMEGLAGSFATALGVGTPKGVFAGVDKVTAEALKAMSQASSSGRSGGGGGAFSCACACAGCACACACAGGGR